MKNIVSNPSLDYARKNIYEWYGVNPTVLQLRRILKDNPEILVEIEAYANPYGMDTCLRDKIMNKICEKLTGFRWPTGLTSDNKAEKIFKAFIVSAKRKRIAIAAKDPAYWGNRMKKCN